MASWIRSPNLSPISRKSTLGTRTKIIFPFVWLKRVGLSQVSYEWRVIFFSSAPKILSHGFAVAVTVAAGNDILGMFPIASRPGARSLTAEIPILPCLGATQSLEHFVVQQKNLNCSAY